MNSSETSDAEGTPSERTPGHRDTTGTDTTDTPATPAGFGSAQLALGGDPTGPLAGVTVVDLSTVVMAPFATQVLGDLGADVIRIEPPFDTARFSPANVGRHPGMGPLYLQVNRNKRSVALNLKKEDDLAHLMDLLESADVFVTNMRGRALTRLGIGYEQIKDRFPGLVYAHGQGFNQRSASANRPAYDEVIQAETGDVDLQRRSVGSLTYMPTFIADKTSSLWLALGVVSALYERRATGLGQHVEIPMADVMIHMNSVEHLSGQVFSPAQDTEIGNPLSLNRIHSAFETADGEAVAAVPYTYADIKLLLTATGDELADDPCWDGDRIDSAAFTRGMDRILATSTRLTLDEWETYLQDNDFPYAVVRDIDGLPDSPYVREMDLMPEVDHPTEGRMRTVANPIGMSRTPVNIRRLPEPAGASTDEVLAALAAVAASGGTGTTGTPGD
ncbi:CaiB/BaiF CoA transferase family protein [Corynebacterium bovis]|uniref:CoA transferase n=1 Tax=Corynebacterium bovis TaxID=36808 RepID=A0A3R8QPX3_9CORY|nr:CoA transferase [Corynebacterium bovis]RRO91584.1 CoA transferase [Corynebacterium bovis]RRO97809.1 CoA transferase [Corynebacterium bovis]RRO99249.1 CoA transferase [Corynebacterium bovis]RRQ00058.1 CoA transferase [Corynebacterium bovis]RRQ02920.1 CoA transferase [Corynebacterium bovis]